MAKEFRLPELGENVEAGDVVAILVKPGDMIAEDQPVLELETDKATVEVPSGVSGIVEAIKVAEGDKVKVGQVVLTILESDQAQSEEEKPASKASPPASAEKPEEKVVGTPVEEPAPVETEPEAASASPAKGDVVDFRRRPSQAAEPAPSGSGKLVPASPAVRRFAREIGIDISRVSGTGPKGRISVEDVKEYSKSRRESGRGVTGIAQLPDLSRFGEVSREPFSNVRRATAQHLSAAWTTIPHVTNHDQADVTELEVLRKKYAGSVEEAGGKLTVTSIVMKTIAVALKRFPKFNAGIDMENEEVVFRHYCNIGVAVDTERGLLVPVIRDVDQKSITEISAELKDVAERARKGKIGLDELQGGCFTITNLGGIGGTSFTPIVNFPEVAILGLSRSTVQPIFREGEFQPRTILPLSLSYDHRLIDGADAARFLRWVASALEEPFLLALD